LGETGGLNLYGYVGNNPIDYFDPSGLMIAPFRRPGGASPVNLIPGTGLTLSEFAGDVGLGSAQGAAAFVDGLIPIPGFNPLASLGLYDPCDQSLLASRYIGFSTEVAVAGIYVAANAPQLIFSLAVTTTDVVAPTSELAEGMEMAEMAEGATISPAESAAAAEQEMATTATQQAIPVETPPTQ
jgi:hypothetical protein